MGHVIDWRVENTAHFGDGERRVGGAKTHLEVDKLRFLQVCRVALLATARYRHNHGEVEATEARHLPQPVGGALLEVVVVVQAATVELQPQAGHGNRPGTSLVAATRVW